MTKEHSHTDLLGQPLVLGDAVVYPSSNRMYVGTVVKLNPKMVGVAPVYSRRSSINKYSTGLVKVSGPEVTLYLLKNNK